MPQIGEGAGMSIFSKKLALAPRRYLLACLYGLACWEQHAVYLGITFAFMLQGAFTGTVMPPWLLEECRSTLTRIARSSKPQAMLAAGALASLSGAFSACSACEVCT